MILTINAGSSNVKFAIFADATLNLLYNAQVASIEELFKWLEEHNAKFNITAVGHRIVHGGTKYTTPVLLSDATIKDLKQLIPLAPLHQPHNMAAVDEIARLYPNLPQIACFDTAFHTTQMQLAKMFALPKDLTTQEKIIRYGFHGLSYEYISSIMVEKIGAIANKKVIVAHLGNGASICAMEQGRSVATSMGFSVLDGLMMGTRCGSIDPGVILYLLQQQNYTPQQISDLLYKDSGLLGVSGISNDMRTLLEDADVAAQTAIDLFCYKAANVLAMLTTSVRGVDAVIFTGGIGENAAVVRAKICTWLPHLGVKINPVANAENNTIISHSDSRVVVAVLATNEELVIARHVKELI